MCRTILSLTCCMGLAASASAFGDVPRLIHYQGKLANSSGGIEPGPVDLRVRLYDSLTNPSPVLFDETHLSVALNRGLFSLLIGSQSGGVPDSAFAGDTVYLGVAVDGAAELSPRIRIAAAPYAQKTKSAEQIVRPGTVNPALSADADGRIGVGTTTPDPSAVADFSSTTGGLLPPRMTTVQRGAISNPAPGLLVYDSDTNCLNMWTGAAWTVMGAPPPAAGITGPATVCANDASIVYSTPDVGASSYSWTVPPGSSIVAGQDTAFLTVTFGTIHGNISVTPSNACGTSASSILSIFVETRPGPETPGLISGPACGMAPGQTGVVYTIAEVPNAAIYTWSVPSDATITSGQGTVAITVTFGSASGNVSVNASNGCGISANSVLPVSVGANSASPGSQTFNATGTGRTGTIQQFTVPAGVICLTIEAWGAQGGSGDGSPGGLGARMKGQFGVTPGQTLKVLVGQQGLQVSCTGGGGGGTFVTDSANNPLIVAGGGGGSNQAGSPPHVGSGGTTDASGLTGTSTNNQHGAGGSGGQGGAGGEAAAGGGLLGNGGNGTSGTPGGGQSFIAGGVGGLGGTSSSSGGPGGFGCGGGAANCNRGAGGGGGYSGGGAGGDNGAGGGGGSYNAGGNQSNSSAVRPGHGQVTFTW